MNWVSKYKLPATKAIKYEGQLYITSESLWRALHATFNTALHCQIDVKVLNKIGSKLTSNWVPFSKEEFRQALVKYNNSSAPGPNKLIWYHLKVILKQDAYFTHITNIVDACINLGHWPNHFKPNKPAYDNSKYFRPIVLLNTLRKLIKKIIADKLQFHVVKNDFIHSSQLGSVMIDASWSQHRYG